MKLYNTLSRQSDGVTPLLGNNIKLYTCGLTVYSQPHIGNWVAYIYWDLLVRTLKHSGFNVERVQNITDVGHLTSDEDAGEDKMLKGALREGLTAWQVADKYIKIADHEAFELLRLIKPEHMPRATDYIAQQIDFVKELEKKGYTYTIGDGVYFDTKKLKDYGKLAQLDIEGLQFGARVAGSGKKNPTDFALWKFSDPAQKRDMEWESPWGKGFPGWHLECSVMAREILGDTIDIHTGGIDHIPVHHVNEIAQTEALTNKPFSKIWLHANHIKVNGTKISKSLGNGYTLQDVIDKGYSLQAFKLLVLSKHYRTEGNFSWEILSAAQNRLKHWQAVADLRWQLPQAADNKMGELLPPLQDDLNSPQAVAIIDAVFEKLEASGQAPPESFLKEIDEVLGINLFSDDISNQQKQLLSARTEARKNKDWETADLKRKELSDQGIGINDTAEKQLWYRV